MYFAYHKQPHWPPLSWVASFRSSSDRVEVLHGARVEKSPDWFGEVVWDGDYLAADFDRTDVVAGSGARLRDGFVEFVSSGSTVDRLVLLEQSSGRFSISNSLPALLAVCSVSMEASYPDYFQDIWSIKKGLSKGVRQLKTTSTPVNLIYYDNYRWDGRHGKRIAKPFPKRDFISFERYIGFLRSCLKRVSENLHHGERKHPYDLVTTISSGYDSPMIAALAREYGCKKALTFSHSRDGIDDSGHEIGTRLGLETISVESDAWKSLTPVEPMFYSTGGMGEVVYLGHQDHLRGSVVLTGYHGDSVWGLRNKYESEDLIRADCSGLALTEYRLSAGFINCPLPFFGARQIVDIHRLARDPEMAAWSLRGTAYNRPICRRVVEEAGVPRELFGMEKKAIGLSSFHLSKSSRSSYLQHLQEHQREWTAKGRIPPIRNKLVDSLIDQAHRRIYDVGLAAVRLRAARQMTVDGMPMATGDTVSEASFVKRVQDFLAQPRNLHRYVVPWAIEECKQNYYR